MALIPIPENSNAFNAIRADIADLYGRFGTNNKLSLRNSRVQFPLRPQTVQQVMASPPTVTTGTATSMTTPFSRYTNTTIGGISMGSYPLDWYSISRCPGMATNNVTNTYPVQTFGMWSMGYSFIHEGPIFELIIQGQALNYFVVKVDDQYVSMTPTNQGSNGVPTFFKYDFTAVGGTKRRRIDVIGLNLTLMGLNHGQTDTVYAAPIRGPRVMFVGDSFLNSTVDVTGVDCTVAFSEAMRWDDVWTPGGQGDQVRQSNSRLNGPTFRNVIKHDVLAYNPELVIGLGSVNDVGQNPGAMGVEATLLYNQIIASGAMLAVAYTTKQGCNTWTANNLDIHDALKKACLNAGGLWLDLMELPYSIPAGQIQPAATMLQVPGSNWAGASNPSDTTVFVFPMTPGIGGSDMPQVGGTIEVDTGAVRERIQIKSWAASAVDSGSEYYSVTFDGAMQYAHAKWTPYRQVGSSYLTGRGKIGALQGFGNCDLFVSADGVHPTRPGSVALGQLLADLFVAAIAPN